MVILNHYKKSELWPQMDLKIRISLMVYSWHVEQCHVYFRWLLNVCWRQKDSLEFNIQYLLRNQDVLERKLFLANFHVKGKSCWWQPPIPCAFWLFKTSWYKLALIKERLNLHSIHCTMGKTYMYISVILKSSFFDRCFPPSPLYGRCIRFASAFSVWRSAVWTTLDVFQRNEF